MVSSRHFLSIAIQWHWKEASGHWSFRVPGYHPFLSQKKLLQRGGYWLSLVSLLFPPLPQTQHTSFLEKCKDRQQVMGGSRSPWAGRWQALPAVMSLPALSVVLAIWEWPGRSLGGCYSRLGTEGTSVWGPVTIVKQDVLGRRASEEPQDLHAALGIFASDFKKINKINGKNY